MVTQQTEPHGQHKILFISRIMFLALHVAHRNTVSWEAEQVSQENVFHDLDGEHGVAFAA
jgi:hypothetical protein